MSNTTQKKQKKKENTNKGGGGGGSGGGGGGGGGGRAKEGPAGDPFEVTVKVGIVKSVVSGDTVQILEIEEGSREPRTFTFSFLGLRAPLLEGRRNSEGEELKQDEDFAWQSREFLRKRIIGKAIIYRVEHEPVEQRVFGEMWDHDAVDLRTEIVKGGWADVIAKQKRTNKEGLELEINPQHLLLESTRDEARSNKRGMWSPKKQNAVRRIKVHEVYRDKNDQLRAENLFEFYKSVKDKGHLPAVVESVRSGTTLSIILTDTYDQFTLMLSGVRSPSVGGRREDAEEEGEPYASEAKFFTEYNLLHRDVKVAIESMDKFNIYGSIITSEGSTSVTMNLLKMGLASFVEWSAPKDPSLLERFREAEKFAQERKLRMWANYRTLSIQDKNKEKRGGGGGKDSGKIKETTFTGKVVEIINPGTITVRVSKGDVNKTVDRIISFSSISAPRTGPPGGRKEDDSKNANEDSNAGRDKFAQMEQWKRNAGCAYYGKEFLRNLLIGQKVRCVFDYGRGSLQNDKTERGPVKLYWSVYYMDEKSEKNVATELVSRGYATVVPHPKEEPRSADFQDLILAENAAKAASAGLHAPVSRRPVVHLNDLTPPPFAPRGTEEEGDGEEKKKRKNIVSKCRPFFNSLARLQKMEAIVDYVFSATRFKLTIPSQNLMLMLNAQGIAADRPEKVEFKKGDAQNKPDVSLFDKQYPKQGHGNIALHFTRDHVYQRKVNVTITGLDLNGNFLGHIYLNNKDFAETLLEHGHARVMVRGGLAKKPAYLDDYKRIEKKARDGLIGYWSDYDFAAEEERKQLRTKERRVAPLSTLATFPIKVSDIRSAHHFSYQQVNADSESLNELSSSLQNENFNIQPPYVPRKNEIVAAQYTVDDQWYRAQIIDDFMKKGAKEEVSQFEVRYIDYGNREVLGKDRMRKLPNEYLDLLTPQAHDGKLAFVKSPHADSEFGPDAAELFRSLVSDKVLNAQETFLEKISKDKDPKKVQTVHHLVLTDEEKKCINVILVSEGLARVEKGKNEYKEDRFYVSLMDAQEEARSHRLQMWQYGYIADSDEETDEV